MKTHFYVLPLYHFISGGCKKIKPKIFPEIAPEVLPVQRIAPQNKFYPHLKLGIVVGIFFIHLQAISAEAQIRLGPFIEQPRISNPLREPIQFSSEPAPAFVDLDGDGDQDVIVADFYGGAGYDYLKNEGTTIFPAFVRTAYPTNPVDLIAFDNAGTPTLTDLDGDGDQDLLVGTIDGMFKYYKNTGTTNPIFTLQTGPWNAAAKTGNPLNAVDLGDYASPVFTDLDSDGDQDLIVGTSFAPFNKSVTYYMNDGQGNFSESTLLGINPNLSSVTPSCIDVDNDGDQDIVLGADDGRIYYFKRVGVNSFEEQTGSRNPFDGIDKGTDSSPAATDIDHDGDTDLIVGAQSSAGDIYYFLNNGNSSFEEKSALNNPFGGVDVGRDASPYFTDIDNDNDLDILLGHRNGVEMKLALYKNNGGTYREEIANNPFINLGAPNSLVPSFIDLDGDGDKDLVGGVDNSEGTSIEYYKNENGLFVQQLFSAGPFKDITITGGKTDFVDIDGDGDFDLFISDTDGESSNPHYFVRFFKNTGTSQSPVFTEITDSGNPLVAVNEEFDVFPRFTDIDHDGDYDALIGEGGNVIELADGNEFSYYENTGTIRNPVFTYRGNLIPQGDNPLEPSPAFTDQDSDGDLDIFIGDKNGYITFYKNDNPAPIATLNSTPLNVAAETGLATVDNQITLTDSDGDLIVKAIISISNFQSGKEVLKFAPQTGITGSFNTASGVLTFQGSATAAVYQSLLRTVALEYSAMSPNGRVRNPKSQTFTRTISLQVFDADMTTPVKISRVVNIVFNQSPVFADKALSIVARGSLSLDLIPLISDVDDNIDLMSLTILTHPGSGASTTIDASKRLNIDYGTLNFTGTETLTLEVCDQSGLCDQSIITLSVTNTSPVIQDQQVTIAFGGLALIDLKLLVSDADGNIDFNSLAIVSQPGSGAKPTISENQQLVIDYKPLNFSGTDQVQIKICDVVNACAQSVITIQVINADPAPLPVEVFNAVAPNSSGDNKFMRILNLPQQNKVSIVNRWGDVVYKVEGYDNELPGKRFEGLNEHGNALPTGTYFYTVEFVGSTQKKQTLTGYLSLKQ
jgi:hypothetical protein